MTVDALVYAALLLLLVSACMILFSRRDAPFLLAWFWFSFLVRLLLIWLNESFELFEAKQADDVVLLLYQSAAEGGSTLQKFGVQLWLNLPAFLVFGAERPIHFVTNAFLGACAGPITHAYLASLFSSRTARLGAVAATLAPAVVNYGFVGLRDIALYLFVLVVVLSSLHLGCGRRFRAGHVLIIMLSLALAVVERPYLVPVMALPALLLAGTWAWQSARQGPARARPLLVFTLVLVIPVMAGLLIAGAYSGLASIINLGGGNPLEAIGTFAQNRFARDIDEGGGSESRILPAETFMSLPMIVRFPLQIVGMIFVPMPWLLTNMTRWLAMVDSVVLIICIVCAIKGARTATWPPRLRRISWILVFTYFVGIAAFGLAVINAGNAFRMRMPLLPLVLIPATIYLAGRLEHGRATNGDPPR